MADFEHRCGRCDALLYFPIGMAAMDCPYCQWRNALPVSEGEELDHLRRANDARRDLQFGVAIDSYDLVLHEHPDEREALWGRVLSLHGVEYVADGDKQCMVLHDPQVKPMSEQPDYLAACRGADDQTRAQYERDAAFVDEVQGRLRQMKLLQEEWEIFLCVDDASPADVALAREVYGLLKDEYRVFAIIGADHTLPETEALICHALCTARVMIVVGTAGSRMRSTWVSSAWMRYLHWVDGDLQDEQGSRVLLSVTQGMSAAQRPEALIKRYIDNLDWARPDAKKALRRVLAKLFDHPPAKQTVPEDVNQTVQNAPVQQKKVLPPAPEPKPAAQPLKTAPDRKSAAPEQKPPTSKRPQATPLTAFEFGKGERAHVIERFAGSMPDVIIPMGVTGIAPQAFKGCKTLRRIAIPDTVTEIGDYAFYGCENLEVVVLRPGLKRIGFSAFGNCRGIKTFDMPDTVTEVGASAFENCRYLTNIHLSRQLGSIAFSVFNKCRRLAVVSIPSGVGSIGSDAFRYCQSLKHIAIPESVTYIATGAFAECPAEMTIRAVDGSAAAQFAQENKIRLT